MGDVEYGSFANPVLPKTRDFDGLIHSSLDVVGREATCYHVAGPRLALAQR